MPSALKLYGRFLMDIINDEEGGRELIERSKKLEKKRAAAIVYKDE